MKILFSKYRQPPTEEEKKQRRKERYLLILTGLLMGCGFPPFPFPCSLLLFIGLIPYLYVLEKRSTLAGINKATYLAFFVFNLITIYWVGSWQKATDPFLMIAGGVLLFFNPILFFIPSTLYYIFKKNLSSKYALFFFPLFWITYEYLYMLTDLSFPWLTLGNGLATFIPFIQIADIIGSVGLSLVILYINLLLYRGIINFKFSRIRSAVYFGSALLIFIPVLSYGIYRMNAFRLTDKTIRVGLIQPNLDPWKKWENRDLNGLTDEYLNLSAEAVSKGAKLIIWPETALGDFFWDGSRNQTVDKIYSFLKSNNVYLLTGLPDVRFYFKGQKIPPDAVKAKWGDYYYTMYNGIILLSPDSYRVQRYDKMKLVPFGEKVPFANEIPFLGKLLSWGVGISGWNVGRDTVNFKLPVAVTSTSEQESTKRDSIKINALVCYESVFPYFVVDFVQRGARMITIVTNDSWYGRSSGPYQHKEIAVLRAVENRRSVIRAANGGISCIIDPLGRTKVQSELFTRTYIVGNVELETGETFFTRHPLIIPVAASLFSFWVFAFFILKRLKARLKA